MMCVYCGKRAGEMFAHYAVCTEAPEFVTLQARAERRAAAGDWSPDCLTPEGVKIVTCERNHVDRGEVDHVTYTERLAASKANEVRA